MSDVFISYVEEDRTLALGLSEGLEAAGKFLSINEYEHAVRARCPAHR